MRGAYRVADIRAAEERLIASLPELTLMHRAAAGLARRCAQLLGDTGGVYGARVLLLVGGGSNGGDALFAGALLADRGAAVRAVLLAPSTVHAAGLAALRRSGGRATAVSDPGDLDAALTESTVDLVMDGIVGIGARGPLRSLAAAAVRCLAALDPRPIVVAVDVPSGVDVESGAVTDPAVRADVTVTFGGLKPAHVVGPAAHQAGLVEVVDIGLSLVDVAPAVWLADRSDVASWWPRPTPESDKYTRGVAGLATGSAGYPGAALLSTAGALAGPTGMVRYAGPVAAEVVRAHPSVVTSASVATAGRVQAWLVGCGCGTDERAATEVRGVLAAPVPVVVDADALTLVASDPALRATLAARSSPTVITPHDREYARLLGAEVGPDRVAGARRLAAELGVVVLLKGDRTIVAPPDGPAWVNPTGTPALATAGTGDVLAGLLVSLLAGGVPAVPAAVAAAYVHGLAARPIPTGQSRAPDTPISTGQSRAAGTPISTGQSRAPDTPISTGQSAGAPVTAPDVANALPIVIGSL